MLRNIESCATCDTSLKLSSNGVNCVICEAKIIADTVERKNIATKEKESGFIYCSVWTRKLERFKILNGCFEKFEMEGFEIVNLNSETKSCNEKDYYVAEIKIPVCNEVTEDYENRLKAIEKICKNMNILSWGIKTTNQHLSVYAKYVVELDDNIDGHEFLKALYFMYEKFKTPILKLTRFYAIPNTFTSGRHYARYSPYGTFVIPNHEISDYATKNYEEVSSMLLREKDNYEANNGLIRIVDNKIIFNVGRPTLYFKSLIALMGMSKSIIDMAYKLSIDKDDNEIVKITNVGDFYSYLKDSTSELHREYVEKLISLRAIGELPSYDEYSNGSGGYDNPRPISEEHQEIVNAHNELFTNDNDEDDDDDY